jgi:hypothetical protein
VERPALEGTPVMRMSPTVVVISNHGDILGGGEISLLSLLEGLDRSR